MIYALTSPKWEGELRLEFHENGILKKAVVPEVFDAASLMYFAHHFPVHINIIDWLKTNTGAKITEITQPVEFDEFWQLYDKKTGSKELARQYWDGEKRTLNKRPITETDRMAIMRIAKRYALKYRGEKKEFQPLASSFLHQRYFETEIESTPRKNEGASKAAVSLMDVWNQRKITEEPNEEK